jgi:large subunit ribosomal protein L7/L12
MTRTDCGKSGRPESGPVDAYGWQTHVVSDFTSSFLPTLGRAFPRVAGAAVGLTLERADGGVLSYLGIVVFVLSVLTNPARWWRYVRTGVKAEPLLAAEFAETGDCSVELQSPGGRPIDVIKALREVTGAGFADAKAKVQTVPSTIAEGLSEESAERVRDRMEHAGATTTTITGTQR